MKVTGTMTEQTKLIKTKEFLLLPNTIMTRQD